MTGTGTQTDPYIVGNWDDFAAAAAITGAYVEFDSTASKKIIDMSKQGFYEVGRNQTVVYIKCASINGNGWIIRGLSWKGCYMFEISVNITVTNLHFEGFYSMGSPASNAIMFRCMGNAVFNDCTFSGVVDNVEFEYHYMESVTYNRCSFNFEFRNAGAFNQYAYNGNSNFNNCNLSFSGETSENYYFLKTNEFNFSYLRGKLGFYNPSNRYFKLMSNISTDLQYGVIDIEIVYKGIDNGTCVIDNPGNILVNSDKISGFNLIQYKNTTFAVTDEQFHDAEYLNSIGFAIGVE